MATFTPNLGLAKPVVDGDDDVWGALLNGNADILDGILKPLMITATGSTTPRSAQDRAAAVANVLDFGAVSGAVVDCTTAFQAAVDTGRSVYIPRGNYKISNAITINTAQLIYGDGPKATLLTIPTNFNMGAGGVFVLSSGTREADVEIRDLWIRFSQPTFAGMTRADILQYPAAINCVALGNRAKFINLQITNCWIGIRYDGGGAGFLDRVEMSGYNIGLWFAEANPVLDGTHVSNFHWWNFDMTANQTPIAWDGVAVAAQIGRIDGLVASDWVIFRGSVNIAATAGTPGFYYMTNIMMDSISSTLTISNAFVFEAVNFHFTKAAPFETPAILITGGRASFSNLAIQASMASTAAIQVAGGSVVFNGGTPWWKETAAAEFVSVTSGSCYIYNVSFASHTTAHTAPFVHQSGTGVLVINGCAFPVSSTGVAVQVDTATAGSLVGVSNQYGGLTVAGAGYSAAILTSLTAQSAVFSSNPTATTGQLTVRPAGGALALESKLRLWGTFPTGGDTAPRLISSIRAGFSSTSWGAGYLDLYISNTTNDAQSDANMLQVARFTTTTLNLGINAVTQGGNAVAADQYYQLNSAAGRAHNIRFLKAGVPKLVLAFTSGDNFVITCNDDAGAGLFNPFSITRLTGLVGMSKGAVISGGASTIDQAVIGATIPAAGTFTQVNLTTAAGPTIRSGAGAATGTQPKGSQWIRTDGAVGSTLYVSQGAGTWNAMAGV